MHGGHNGDDVSHIRIYNVPREGRIGRYTEASMLYDKEFEDWVNHVPPYDQVAHRPLSGHWTPLQIDFMENLKYLFRIGKLPEDDLPVTSEEELMDGFSLLSYLQWKMCITKQRILKYCKPNDAGGNRWGKVGPNTRTCVNRDSNVMTWALYHHKGNTPARMLKEINEHFQAYLVQNVKYLNNFLPRVPKTVRKDDDEESDEEPRAPGTERSEERGAEESKREGGDERVLEESYPMSDFTREKIIGDGNCLFRAINALNGNEDDTEESFEQAKEVREEMIDHILDSEDVYFGKLLVEYDDVEDWRTRLKTMKTPDVHAQNRELWGSDEFLVVASTIYRKSYFQWERLNGDSYFLSRVYTDGKMFNVRTQTAANRQLFRDNFKNENIGHILYIDENHYEVLHPKFDDEAAFVDVNWMKRIESARKTKKRLVAPKAIEQQIEIPDDHNGQEYDDGYDYADPHQDDEPQQPQSRERRDEARQKQKRREERDQLRRDEQIRLALEEEQRNQRRLAQEARNREIDNRQPRRRFMQAPVYENTSAQQNQVTRLGRTVNTPSRFLNGGGMSHIADFFGFIIL